MCGVTTVNIHEMSGWRKAYCVTEINVSANNVFGQLMLLKIGVVLFKVRIDIVPLLLLSQELLPLTLMRKGEDNQILTVLLRFGC